MATLIQAYQDFVNWINNNSLVKVVVKESDKTAYTQIRKAIVILKELTISDKKQDKNGKPLLIHSIEQQENKWQITAGGGYREVRPGIYSLFSPTSFTFHSILIDALNFLQCPYCQALLFGVDQEICEHLFLRFDSKTYWAPELDKLIAELNQKLKAPLNIAQDFKKFLISNPQLDWKRFSHREENNLNENTEVMAFVIQDPQELLKHFIRWASGVPLDKMARTTNQALRLTGRRKIILPEQNTEETTNENLTDSLEN